MKRIIQSLIIIIITGFTTIQSQTNDSIEVFFLTCNPGTEVYSIYGHSAVRVVIPEQNIDLVYNWGIFDFATPNFIWKFSKGRLDYMIGTYSYSRFIEEYEYEQRSVYSQKINLNQKQKENLLNLVNLNMLPENRLYRYDFFYDNCATRIRDLLEKSIGKYLVYPKKDILNPPTFREKLTIAQKPLPWLNVGINLLIGLPGDKPTSFRERMFLPEDLMKNLSLTFVSEGNAERPLLQEPVTIINFDPKITNKLFLLTPTFIFWMLLIFIVLLTWFRKSKTLRIIDLSYFFVFSILSGLMIFFTFFTDHMAMKMNLNIIWINPVLIFCLLGLFFPRFGKSGFRIIFFTSLIFLWAIPFIPQYIDRTLIPLILILVVRSLDHSNFGYNPFKLINRSAPKKYDKLI